jgi:hypothetical protein
MTTPSPLHNDVSVIRPAGTADAAPLARLARLDSSRPLSGPVLIATRDDEPVAALATDTGRVIADPFTPTTATIELLRVHARVHGRTARSWRHRLRHRPIVHPAPA